MDSANNLLAAHSGFCLLCTAKTSLVCHRCGDFYCSKECQIKDWQRHRYICFSIPPLVHSTTLSVLAVAEPSSPLQSVSSEAIRKVEPEIKSELNINELQVDLNSQTSKESSCVATTPALLTSTILKECDKNNNASIVSENIPCTVNSNAIQKNADLTNKKNIVNSNETQKKADLANTQSIGINGTQKKTDLTTYRPPNAIMPPSGSIVCIAEFMSPNRCFVLDASKTAKDAYSKICEKVNLMGKEQPKKLKIKPHEYALVNINGRFHRVKAIGKQSFQPRLLFLDEGTVQIGKNTEFREISSELLKMPFCSLQVQLKDVPNFILNDEVNELLKQYLGHKFMATYTGNGPVELRHVDTQMSLNVRICEFCSNLNIFGKQSLSNKQISTDNLQVKKKETDSSENSTAQCQIPIESIKKQTNIEKANTKSQQPLTAESDSAKTDNLQAYNKDLILNKDRATGTSYDQSPKTNHDLNDVKLDSISITEQKQTNIEKVNPKSQQEVETDPVKTDNLQAYDKDLILNNDKAADISYDQCPKINHDLKEIKLDSQSLTDENDKENKNKFTQKIIEDLKIMMKSKEHSETTNSTMPPLQRQEINPPNDIPPPNRTPLLKPPFEVRRLNVSNKEGLNAIIVDNTNVSRGIVGAFDSIYSSDSSKVYSYLTDFKDSQPYKPILKEYIIAKYENSWYRAKVMEIKQNVYTVMYLEFTNVATVTEQDIRRYPTELTVPCNTSVCLIEGFPHRPTKRQIDYLEEKLQMNSRLHIDSVSYLQDMALIKCKALIDELNKYK